MAQGTRKGGVENFICNFDLNKKLNGGRGRKDWGRTGLEGKKEWLSSGHMKSEMPIGQPSIEVKRICIWSSVKSDLDKLDSLVCNCHRKPRD